jgi:EPS-associated MarR family transcriptional regulator
MKKIKLNLNQFEILRIVSKKPKINQREMATNLNISLGKINYLINELKKKGLIKINNFTKNPKKLGYLYYLTPRGILEKTTVTINFMKIKLEEYKELKKEIEKK